MIIRPARPGDLAAVNEMHDAAGRSRWAAAVFARTTERLVVVAEWDGVVVGAAKTHFYPERDTSEPGSGQAAAPAGHYLGGLSVHPDFRRRGVGLALTEVRLEWIWARARRAYYFANENNTASIRLHERLGFEELGRYERIFGVTGDAGSSALRLFVLARPGVG